MTTVITPSPYYVDWAITHRCNLRCTHCRGLADSELGTGRALTLLDEIRELQPGWLIIEGGEPLMRQDLFSILRYAHELGLTVLLISNGMLLTPSAIDWLAGNGVGVMLSIDSPDASTFERLRRGASFSIVLRSAAACARTGILNAVNFTLSRENAAQIPGLFRMARDVGAARINILGLKPCERYAEQLLTGTEYRGAIEACCRASAETGVRFFFDEPFFSVAVREWRCPYSPDTQGSAITIGGEPGCIIGKYLFITSSGDVWPCSFAPRVIDNVMRKSLGAIWDMMQRSDEIQEMRSPRRKGACGTCRFLNECRGCRARAFRLTGDWLGADPACPLLADLSPVHR
ncbi:MAG: radical SAM protein [Candidatus Aureabacteria bacterium]|nr:radical SAM protein [Candidatus Auribacterota bacterium]